MTTQRKAAIFLALTFAISWSAASAAWLGGMRDLDGGEPPPIFGLFVFGPAIAAIICVAAFEKGQRTGR